jgi:hypothetical protein
MRAGSTLIERGTALAPFMGARGGPVTPDRDTGPRRVSPQLKVCNLSFSELSAWRSNTCVAMPEKVAGLPSLSLPLALHRKGGLKVLGLDLPAMLPARVGQVIE